MIDISDLIYKILMKYYINMFRDSCKNAFYVSVLSVVNENIKESVEENIENIIAEALSLPLPVKDVKLERDKITVILDEAEANS